MTSPLSARPRLDAAQPRHTVNRVVAIVPPRSAAGVVVSQPFVRTTKVVTSSADHASGVTFEPTEWKRSATSGLRIRGQVCRHHSSYRAPRMVCRLWRTREIVAHGSSTCACEVSARGDSCGTSRGVWWTGAKCLYIHCVTEDSTLPNNMIQRCFH